MALAIVRRELEVRFIKLCTGIGFGSNGQIGADEATANVKTVSDECLASHGAQFVFGLLGFPLQVVCNRFGARNLRR
jgi:hypothetical protein